MDPPHKKGNTLKKIVSGAAVMVAAVGSLLVGTAAPAGAYTDNFGAIALSPSTGRIGYSYDYSDRDSAKDGAMQSCTFDDCRVVASFANGCGAVAYSRRAGLYTYGAAYSRSTARTQALNRNSSDATIIHWNCTTGYEL
ncbi:DUF4189 domain-containing protein [Nocardia sp. NBC_01503]|uniref:DUF4189 domain-containing protein n=1 Tax=Nocardia sp. NBC_01503 TaxID=2975997 RepID=UPI002E7C151A|nr:DUF4189 domain-containing protein [Nocardia sp. NBC_01503]WTL29783.1 DUF4189 domain-containing protein [Nocardia sp. NBC_01503]